MPAVWDVCVWRWWLGHRCTVQRDSGVGASDDHLPPAPAAAGTKESKGSSSGYQCESMETHTHTHTHTQVYTGKLKYTLTQTVTELACQEHRWLGKNKRLNQYSTRALNWVTCAFSLPVKGGNPSGPKLHTQSIFKTSYTQNLHEFTWKADSTASGCTHTGGDPSVSSGSLLFSSLSLFLLPSYVWRNGFVVMQVIQRPPKCGSLVFTAIPRPLRLWPQ